MVLWSIVDYLFSWLSDILNFVNNNWLVRDFFVVGFFGFCLDLIFSHRKED